MVSTRKDQSFHQRVQADWVVLLSGVLNLCLDPFYWMNYDHAMYREAPHRLLLDQLAQLKD